MQKKNCYSISTYSQLIELLKINKKKQKISIIFLNSNLIKGFGIDWLNTLIKIAKKKSYPIKVEFYIDCGHNYGLSINLIEEKIEYIKLKSNKIIMKKINQIATQNKVLLNPNFDVVDLTKIKKIENIKKLIS